MAAPTAARPAAPAAAKGPQDQINCIQHLLKQNMGWDDETLNERIAKAGATQNLFDLRDEGLEQPRTDAEKEAWERTQNFGERVTQYLRNKMAKLQADDAALWEYLGAAEKADGKKEVAEEVKEVAEEVNDYVTLYFSWKGDIKAKNSKEKVGYINFIFENCTNRASISLQDLTEVNLAERACLKFIVSDDYTEEETDNLPIAISVLQTVKITATIFGRKVKGSDVEKLRGEDVEVPCVVPDELLPGEVYELEMTSKDLELSMSWCRIVPEADQKEQAQQ